MNQSHSTLHQKLCRTQRVLGLRYFCLGRASSSQTSASRPEVVLLWVAFHKPRENRQNSNLFQGVWWLLPSECACLQKARERSGCPVQVQIRSNSGPSQVRGGGGGIPNQVKIRSKSGQNQVKIRSGPDLDPIWTRFGPDLDPIWTRLGTRFGPDLDPIRTRFRPPPKK